MLGIVVSLSWPSGKTTINIYLVFANKNDELHGLLYLAQSGNSYSFCFWLVWSEVDWYTHCDFFLTVCLVKQEEPSGRTGDGIVQVCVISSLKVSIGPKTLWVCDQYHKCITIALKVAIQRIQIVWWIFCGCHQLVMSAPSLYVTVIQSTHLKDLISRTSVWSYVASDLGLAWFRSEDNIVVSL